MLHHANIVGKFVSEGCFRRRLQEKPYFALISPLFLRSNSGSLFIVLRNPYP